MQTIESDTVYDTRRRSQEGSLALVSQTADNEERPHDSLGRVPPLTFLPRPTPAGGSTYTVFT